MGHLEKPPLVPLTAYVLGGVALAGLVAQYLAARAAFDQIVDNPLHSIAAALLIEAAAVVDALVLMRSRSWPAGLGLVVALLVSGTYNYIQAEIARPAWGWWRLGTIAVGPLAALTSIGLALGEELRRHEARRDVWQVAVQQRQAEMDAEARQREILAQRQAEAETTRQRQIEAEERAFRRELERQRLEHELHEQALATRRRERRSRDRTVTGQADSDRTTDRTMTGQRPGGRSSGRKWPDKASFLADPDRPDGLTGEELAEMADISPRTARRWLAEARNGRG